MTTLEKLNELEAKQGERAALIAQLRRQLEVKEKHGIEAHEIKSIVLIPRGYSTPKWKEVPRKEDLLYGSRVTMKNGEVRSFPDANIKAELDGPDWRAP